MIHNFHVGQKDEAKALVERFHLSVGGSTEGRAGYSLVSSEACKPKRVSVWSRRMTRTVAPISGRRLRGRKGLASCPWITLVRHNGESRYQARPAHAQASHGGGGFGAPNRRRRVPFLSAPAVLLRPVSNPVRPHHGPSKTSHGTTLNDMGVSRALWRV